MASPPSSLLLPSRALLCSPAPNARWLHGRVFLASHPPRVLTLLAAERLEQHECMMDDLLYDVALLDHASGSELRLDCVARGGGSVITLRGRPATASSPELTFEPSLALAGARARAAATRFFPEILEAETAQRAGGEIERERIAGEEETELIVVEGKLVLRGGDAEALRWRPLTLGADQSGAAEPGTAAELLQRTWPEEAPRHEHAHHAGGQHHDGEAAEGGGGEAKGGASGVQAAEGAWRSRKGGGEGGVVGS